MSNHWKHNLFCLDTLYYVVVLSYKEQTILQLLFVTLLLQRFCNSEQLLTVTNIKSCLKHFVRFRFLTRKAGSFDAL